MSLGGGTELPDGYIEYNNGTITVHDSVTFTSGGPSILNVESGTLTVTGGVDASLTLNNSSSYAVSIGGSNSQANFVLAGDVDFTAVNTGDSGTAVSINGALKTAEGYSGDTSFSAKNNIVFFKSGNYSGTAQIDLKTSGSVKMETNGSYPILSVDSLSLEGSSVVFDAPNANPMLQASGNISITSTGENLNILSTAASPASIISITSDEGTVTLSAPKGDITIKSTAEGGSNYNYPSQAVSANNVVVNNAKSFKVEGNYLVAAVAGNLTTTDCPSINVANGAPIGSAVSGSVNITGDGSEDSQAVFTSSATTVIGDTAIKSFEEVDIKSSTAMAICYGTLGDNDNVDIEDCGSVQIEGNGSRGAAVGADNNVQFKNCKSVEISADEAEAVTSNNGKIAFEKCDSVSVHNNSTNRSAIAAYKGTTTFTGCGYVSVKTGGAYTSAIDDDNYTCDGKIIITEKGTTKIIENGKDPITTGGDVTNTGLELGSKAYPLPTEQTTYVAGSGTITFIPATKDTNAKLVLNNAEIDQRNWGRSSAIFFEDNVDIEINGTNEFLALHGIISNGTINISGSGTLTVEAEGYAVSTAKDVVVNSGTLVLSGQYGIYSEKNITVEGGNITVIPSDAVYGGESYGLYADEGNITINKGTLKISSDVDDVRGIYACDRNDGIANIYIHGGTVNVAVDNVAICGFDDIEIDGSANVTAKSYNSEGVYTKGNIKIGDNANVTVISNDTEAINVVGKVTVDGNARVKADGAGNTVDIYTAEDCTVAESAKLTALVQTGNNYIAYGICDNNDIVKDMDISKDSTLKVKAGAEFTVNAGTGVSISDLSALTLDGKLINNGMLQIGITDTTEVPKGKIVNNGALLLAFADDEVDVGAVIREMELTGSNLVYVQTGSGENAGQDVYTTDGTKLNQITSIDLSNENLSGNLDTDGYHWDNENKILTLKDVLVSGIIDSLTDDVTIQTEGNVAISEMRNSSGGKITVTGDSATIMFLNNNGDIIFKDITANVYGIWAYNEQEEAPQVLNDSNDTNNDNYSYGVTLINSKVTVGGPESSEIRANKLTMDDNSVLTLKYAQLECDTADGLAGIEKYLPQNSGYKIGKAPDEDEEFYTILDSSNNIVRDITLKKAETTKPGGSSGGGGSSAKSYDITVKSAENGKVEASKKSASKNATITLTVTADEGYQLDKLTVLDSKNGTIALTDQNNGKFEFKMPDGNVTVEATFVKKAVEEEKPTGEKPETKAFADVPANAWFKKAVDYVNGKGLMSGVDENNFGPELLTNRAMLVTILWRMEGCPTSEQATTFTDIKATDYFYNAVLWAAENKIVSGVSETGFAPNDSITREQLAAILYRYAAYKGYDVTQGGMAVREFSDYEKISSYARSSVAWAVNAGIVSGKGNNTLDPGGVATRAEVASMLMRFCENIVK